MSEEGYNVFLDFLDEIFFEFGINEDLKEETFYKEMLIECSHRFCQTGDRFELNNIKIWKNKIETLRKNKSEGVDFNKELGRIMKESGVFDPKKVSVHQYLSLRNG